MATVTALKLLTLSSPFVLKPPQLTWVCCGLISFRSPPLESRSRCVGARFSTSSKSDPSVKETTAKKKKKKEGKGKGKGKVDGGNGRGATAMEALLKRRTRSSRELDDEMVQQLLGVDNHIPVLLGEVLDVFSGRKLRSFADCTLGAAGHSSAIIQAHPELQCYLGMDVDPMAHQMAKTKIDALLHGDSLSMSSNLRGYFLLRNFRFIKSVVDEVADELMDSGFDGILMDLGVSSMQVNNAERGFSVLNDGPLDMRMDPQASLKAEDILNSWPESEVGRILREYGEESNWFSLQNKIVKSRVRGGLHSTRDLEDKVG
ncbi:ribosomal RNA small subunit methyltransferase H isoform X2 [Rhodamnia argentea]|uniref:Ribosomal RNA small subunit methyltransferase H isoform X2 n=1 Tax=Rhodamnia argentea TaxID=178133 RepID=A0A8B8Q7U9_9MYRT|nr:ribosomal RNA small subunit methyltransferase H isoform X2 [Rhodamnia argentea]